MDFYSPAAPADAPALLVTTPPVPAGAFLVAQHELSGDDFATPSPADAVGWYRVPEGAGTPEEPEGHVCSHWEPPPGLPEGLSVRLRVRVL